MYHYGFMPQQPYTIMFLHPNSQTPYSSGRYTDAYNGFVLPPIQMHNYSSRPYPFLGNDLYYPQNFTNGHIEYHHFYGVNPLNNTPNWYYPNIYQMPTYNHYMNFRSPQTIQKPLSDAWPEGFTMKGELQWGKLERVFGLKRELPDFVKDDLRRVYGTYPRTFVAITYQNGEYLVKGNPKVGEQEYTVEKKVIRKASTPTDSEEDTSDERSRKMRKRKARR